MAIDFDTIPSTRIKELVLWCSHTNRVPTRQISREYAEAFYQDKPHRMSPWGIQFQVRQGNTNALWWLPPKPGNHNIEECRSICGSWIRDEPINAKRRYWESLSVDCSQAVRAFRHGEITDPPLEVAVFSAVEAQVPLTTASKITELPTEIIQQILGNLMPSGGAFQFFPARMAGSTHSMPCVQRFVRERNIDQSDSHLCWGDCPCHAKMTASTASTHMAIAATCRYLQDQAYALFYSQNTFVFHLTTCAIRTEMGCSDLENIGAWSRRLPQHNSPRTRHQYTGLGPLTPRAVAYLRNILLIPSTPPAPSSRDLASLTGLMQHVSTSLRHARLKSITVDFQQPSRSTSTDKRFTSTVLTIDSLELVVDEEYGLSVVPRNPKITFARDRNRTQQILVPLLDVQGAFPKTDKLILNGFMSERTKADLEEAFAGSLSSVPGDRLDAAGLNTDEMMIEAGARKRKRL